MILENTFYSQDRFKEEYSSKFDYSFLPKIQEYENKRILTLVKFFLVSLIILIPGTYFKQHIWIAILMIINAANYNAAYKKIVHTIPHELADLLPGFVYDEYSPISLNETSRVKLFPSKYSKPGLACIDFSDSFSGDLSGINVCLVNYEYSILYKKSSLTLFKGFILKFNFDNALDGNIVIRPKSKEFSDTSDLINAGYKAYDDVSSSFKERYYILTNNVQAAKRYLNPQFMVVLDTFSKAMGDRLYCSIYEDTLYIATTKGKPFVNFEDITKQITKKKHYKYFYNIFYEILRLTNSIRIDRNYCIKLEKEENY